MSVGRYTIPPIHLAFIIVSSVLILVFTLAHIFTVDKEKVAFYSMTITGLVGFLTGKLTNMFGVPLGTKREPVARTDKSERSG